MQTAFPRQRALSMSIGNHLRQEWALHNFSNHTRIGLGRYCEHLVASSSDINDCRICWPWRWWSSSNKHRLMAIVAFITFALNETRHRPQRMEHAHCFEYRIASTASNLTTRLHDNVDSVSWTVSCNNPRRKVDWMTRKVSNMFPTAGNTKWYHANAGIGHGAISLSVETTVVLSSNAVYPSSQGHVLIFQSSSCFHRHRFTVLWCIVKWFGHFVDYNCNACYCYDCYFGGEELVAPVQYLR